MWTVLFSLCHNNTTLFCCCNVSYLHVCGRQMRNIRRKLNKTTAKELEQENCKMKNFGMEEERHY